MVNLYDALWCQRVKKEFDKGKEKSDKPLLELSPLQDDDEGNFILSVDNFPKDILYERYSGLFNGTSSNPVNFSKLLNNIRIRRKYTLKEAIHFITDIYVGEAKKALYGVLLYNEEKKVLLNPLHPIVAKILADRRWLSYWFLEYEIIIYSFKEEIVRNKDELNMAEYNKRDIKKIFEQTIRNSFNYATVFTATETTTEEEKESPSLEEIHLAEYTNCIKENILSKLPKNNTKKNYKKGISKVNRIVPAQVFSQVMKYPFYGIILTEVKENAEEKGENISPFFSGNIDSPESYEEHTEDCWETLNSRQFGNTNYIKVNNSICFGDIEENKDSLFNNNHVNTDSVFIPFTLTNNWLDWLELCIEKSLEIYKGKDDEDNR